MRIGSWWFVSEIDEVGRDEDEQDDQRDHYVVGAAAALVRPPDVALDRFKHFLNPTHRRVRRECRERRERRVGKVIHYPFNASCQLTNVEVNDKA